MTVTMIDKFDFVKIENFSPPKDTMKRMKGKIQTGRRNSQFISLTKDSHPECMCIV